MQQTPEQIQALLVDARASYHALLTGTKARVVVDQNGQRVEFTSANSDKLAAYIRSLELLLCPVSSLAATRPVGFLF